MHFKWPVLYKMLKLSFNFTILMLVVNTNVTKEERNMKRKYFKRKVAILLAAALVLLPLN